MELSNKNNSMIKIKILIIGLCVSSFGYGQLASDTCRVNESCETALIVDQNSQIMDCTCPPTTVDFWYKIDVVQPYQLNFFVNAGSVSFNYELYGPFDATFACDPTELSAGLVNSGAAVQIIDDQLTTLGVYYIKMQTNVQCPTITTNFVNIPEEICETCVGSFSLTENEKFLIGAWAKEDGAPLDKTSYDQPMIKLIFDTPGGQVTIPASGGFQPIGLIIDGWQRIEEEFLVPAGATNVQIEMSCATGDCFFDDIRVFPFDASMKTYVYDPIFMRLAAELDERHYATFYEYNEEGQLIRIKKETEKGILTIQETTNNSSK